MKRIDEIKTESELRDIQFWVIRNLNEFLDEFWDISAKPIESKTNEEIKNKLTELNIPLDTYPGEYGILESVQKECVEEWPKPIEALVKAIWMHGNAMGIRSMEVGEFDYKKMYYEGIDKYLKLSKQSLKDMSKIHGLEAKHLKALKRIQTLSPEYDEKLEKEITALEEKVNKRSNAASEVQGMIGDLLDGLNE